jgi:hypothetical protein
MTTIPSDGAADAHRNAYNAAFHELGLSWFWDSERYRNVLCGDDERSCLRSYLLEHQPHLLTAYDAEFLVEAIQHTKERCYALLSAAGGDPGAYINWGEIQQRQAGV